MPTTDMAAPGASRAPPACDYSGSRDRVRAQDPAPHPALPHCGAPATNRQLLSCAQARCAGRRGIRQAPAAASALSGRARAALAAGGARSRKIWKGREQTLSRATPRATRQNCGGTRPLKEPPGPRRALPPAGWAGGGAVECSAKRCYPPSPIILINVGCKTI